MGRDELELEMTLTRDEHVSQWRRAATARAVHSP